MFRRYCRMFRSPRRPRPMCSQLDRPTQISQRLRTNRFLPSWRSRTRSRRRPPTATASQRQLAIPSDGVGPNCPCRSVSDRLEDRSVERELAAGPASEVPKHREETVPVARERSGAVAPAAVPKLTRRIERSVGRSHPSWWAMGREEPGPPWHPISMGIGRRYRRDGSADQCS